MKTIEDFPERVRKSVRTVSKRLKTDYETAYRTILLEAALYDLSPSDADIVGMLAPEEEEPCGSA